MSNKLNDAWIEAAHENFAQALSEGNISLARAVVQDMKDVGFRNEAKICEDELKEFENAL